MCAIVYYTKQIKSRLYPKAARTGPYAFAEEVYRVDGRVVTKYIGIRRVHETGVVVESRSEAEDEHSSGVIESRIGEAATVIERRDEHPASVIESKTKTLTTPANPNRFSRNLSEYRASHTDAESSFLASLNWYGIAAERDCRIVDWSSVRCASCKTEFALEGGEASILGPHDELPVASCHACGGKGIPRAFLPNLLISREKRVVIEISGKKSSIHDRAKVDFYYREGIRWIEVTNETAKSPTAVKAVCQALAVLVGSSHPERIWGYEELP